MNTFWQHLGDPEYLHVLINPLPVYGLAVGVLGLVLALCLRTPRVTMAALVLVFVTALSAWPTYYYGEAGYDRVKALSDDVGTQWLDEHMARGEKMIWMFYVLAGLAAFGVAATVKWPRATLAVTAGTLLWGMATLGVGGYIAYAGGHVRHKEFRFEPPPPPSTSEHHAQGMDHSSMPGMEPAKSPGPKEQPLQPETATSPASPAPPSQEQLEASRLQLEASRLQLDKSISR